MEDINSEAEDNKVGSNLQVKFVVFVLFDYDYLLRLRLSFILHYSYKIYITFVEVSYKTKQN